jgi:enamine deaminase RidA (YjgF/YER057c/UK114 family)
MPHQHLHPPGLHVNPAYSHVVVASGRRLIYTAGQVPLDAHGNLVGPDLEAQAMQAFRNVGLALNGAGVNYADVVKITMFVVNYRPEHRAVLGRARAHFFSEGAPPASTLLGVAALAVPEWLVEIEAVAVAD